MEYETISLILLPWFVKKMIYHSWLRTDRTMLSVPAILSNPDSISGRANKKKLFAASLRQYQTEKFDTLKQCTVLLLYEHGYYYLNFA